MRFSTIFWSHFPSCIHKSAEEFVCTSEFCRPSPHHNHHREEGKTKRTAQNEAVICPWAICQFLSLSQAETLKNQAKNTAKPLEPEAKISAVHQCYRDRSWNSWPTKIGRGRRGRVELAHILAFQLRYNSEENYIFKFPVNLKYPL